MGNPRCLTPLTLRTNSGKSKRMSNQSGKEAVSASSTGDATTPVHLIVFIHGFEGTANDFDNAEKAFLRHAQHSRVDEAVIILKAKGNSGFGGTYDGIEKGSIRVWREVMTEINKLRDRLKSISFVGHSLGGLYARFVARLLNDCLIFESIEPRYFVTLATPHLSVRRPLNTPANIVFQKVAKVLCTTVTELCMEDDAVKPLLYRMCNDSYVTILSKFKRRVLYSNVANDFQVHYSTASISTSNPYTKDSNKLTRSESYPDITAWSLTAADDRRRHQLDSVEDFAKSDARSSLLRAMFVRLNEMEWERFDAVFPTVFAHEQIINKRSMFAGRSVIRHLCERMLGPQIMVSPTHFLVRAEFTNEDLNGSSTSSQESAKNPLQLSQI